MARIKYGISKFTVGAFTITPAGAGRAGTPVQIPGIVELTLEAEAEAETFRVDGLPSWAGEVFSNYTGDLTGALFTEPLQEAVLIKGTGKQRSYIAFESSGDTPERVIVYNVAFAFPDIDHTTRSNQDDPGTETLELIAIGDNDTRITLASFKEGDRFFDQLLENPPDPEELTDTYLQDENYVNLADENDDEIIVRREFL